MDVTPSMRPASSATPTGTRGMSIVRRRWWRCCARASSAMPRPRRWSEVGGPSLSYGELWERAARVAGGLRDAGVERGDRVAIRLDNGDRLGAGVLRRADARRGGRAGQHALHRGGGRPTSSRTQGQLHLRPRRRAARRRAGRSWRTWALTTWPRSSTRAARPGSPRAR